MYRFALRNQSKIISTYSIQFNAVLIDSLKQYFKTEIKIIRCEKYDIIKCPNIRDNSKFFEFYIIKQVYDVLTLSFNPN